MTTKMVETESDEKRQIHLIYKQLKNAGCLDKNHDSNKVMGAIRRGLEFAKGPASEIQEVNIMGVIFFVREVAVVNKECPRKGEINFITNEIRIDKDLSPTSKKQVLMHEILHAVFDLLGLYELAEDENKVQSIATALHHVFTTQTIFS